MLFISIWSHILIIMIPAGVVAIIAVEISAASNNHNGVFLSTIPLENLLYQDSNVLRQVSILTSVVI